MLKSFLVHLFFVFNVVIRTHAVLSAHGANEEDPSAPNISPPATSYDDECLTNSFEKSLYCRGSRALRNVIYNLNKSEKPIVIVRGLEIVRSRDARTVNATADDVNGASENANVNVDESFLGRFSKFLRSHELNIKFSDLLGEESERFLARDLEWNGVKIGATADASSGAGYVEEARKKDKGQGIIMAMALMFGKLMAVLGMGSIGALALKALGIAMAALMMAGIVGLKSLSQHGGGGGGHEGGHSVQYLAPDLHHHRRRRRSLSLRKQLYESKQSTNIKDSVEMAFHGWKPEMLSNGRAKYGEKK